MIYTFLIRENYFEKDYINKIILTVELWKAVLDSFSGEEYHDMCFHPNKRHSFNAKWLYVNILDL